MADVFNMPPLSAGFDARAGWVVQRLLTDFDVMKLNHAGGVVGNLGGESGLEAINEKHPLVVGSRGGFGWGQWTGDRRRAFEAWCAGHGLDITSDEANYRWLCEEMRGPEHHALDQVLKTTSIEAATETFEAYYERPADLRAGLRDRIAFAKRAITASLGLAHVEHFANEKPSVSAENQKPAPVVIGLPVGSSTSSDGPGVDAAARDGAPPAPPGDAPGAGDQVDQVRARRRRRPAQTLHLAGGMGIGYALTQTLTWALGLHSIVVPENVAGGWVLLLAIPGAILLHKLPWLQSELGEPRS